MKIQMMAALSVSTKEDTQQQIVTEGEHIIGEFIGNDNGATLAIFGGVHGNEPSGILAMRNILPKLAELKDKLNGRIYFLAGNTRALNKNQRFIDYDLNRQWTLEQVEQNNPNSSIFTDKIEDIEQREILTILDKIFSTSKDEVYAIDLHSTSSESKPFALFGDTLRNREFARKFPATFLLGIEEQLDGTLTEYLNNLGLITLGFEAGQHTDKNTIESQEALIWLALVHSGILPKNAFDFDKQEKILHKAMNYEQKIIEIRHRHAIKETDKFKMKEGYENFQSVQKGEILAKDKNGEIKAKETGLILMPLYQKQGSDGFFLGREISSFWLWLSKILRNVGITDLIRLLPGVQRKSNNKDVFNINTGIARFFPLQIFHLLGLRKIRWKKDKLIVSRRKFDTQSPFTK